VAFKTEEVFSTLDKLPHKESILFLNDNNIEATKILAASEALCYVSQFEGFGIPILEAFASEVAVITSNVSSMPEVAGKAAYLVDPHNISSIADAMVSISSDPILRHNLIARGKEQKDLFSWNKSAELIYKELSRLNQAK